MLRIILDTDPGIDDALALFLALALPQIRLEAVTTVNGNVSVEHTTRNALTLLTLAGRTDIPVARGCSAPLLRVPMDASHVHGENGLGNVIFPTPSIQPTSSHAVDLIIEKIMNAPGEITLVPIGPLTNIALAVRKEPALTSYVREVVLMGGALHVPGNVTPSAEFNIWADPEAAHIVLHAGWPLRIVSLDVTTQATLSRADIEALARYDTPVINAIRQIMAFYFEVFAPASGHGDIFHMHDPLCLAAAFQPDLITWTPAYVDVELQGRLTLGQTVSYLGRHDAPPANALVPLAVDAERFRRFYLDAIAAAFA